MNPITLTPAAAPATPAPTHGAAAADEAGDKPTFANELQRATKPAAPDKPARGAHKSETPAETARKPAAKPTHAADTTDPKADKPADEDPLATEDTPTADAGTLLAGLLGQPQRPAERSGPAAGGRSERAEGDAKAVEGAGARRGAAVAAEAAPDKLKVARPDADTEIARAAADDKAQQPAFVLPQAAAQAAAPAPRPEAATTGADVRVPQHVASPEFAPGLGAQVSLLVKDGVQEARLQLNPAEMGPITVQIQVDGSNAQVSFSAEHAFTRDRIEQALPVLAGALQESGLTLTGGGVFEQQPRQPQGDTAPGARSRGAAAAGGDGGDDIAPVAARAPRAARGAVDLYA